MLSRLLGRGPSRLAGAPAALLALAGCGGDPLVAKIDNLRTDAACACLTDYQLGLMNDCAFSMTADAVDESGADADGGVVDVIVQELDGDPVHTDKLTVTGKTLRWSWTPSLPLSARRDPFKVVVQSRDDDDAALTILELTADVIDPTTPGPFVLCSFWTDPAGMKIVPGTTLGRGVTVGMQARLTGDVTTPFTLALDVFEDDNFTDDDFIESVPATVALDGVSGAGAWATIPQTDDPDGSAEYYFRAATTITGQMEAFDSAQSRLIDVP